MCGVAGLYRPQGTVSHDEIKRMIDVLSHRGPDGEGIHISGGMGLGHKRLSIIDLREVGNQPLCNEDSNIWLSFNGEIYNFQELQDELKKRGHRFKSKTDSEVIIHAYEEWGMDCLAKFNGMFAFALWDNSQKKLFLVRDRLGIKPLFYSQHSGTLWFASEIKAILSQKAFQRALNLTALHHFLSFNYMPAPYTLFENIHQVLPGHYIIFDKEGNSRDVEYWDLIFNEEDNKKDTFYIGTFKELMHNVIKDHLISDVPFGAFLSGGIDSSGILYWMTLHMENPVKTFSIGFPEKTYNELPFAKSVSEHLRTEHYEELLKPDLISMLPEVVWHAEEPTADSSMIPLYFLSKLASTNVKMVLTGDGGDEIFAGYETYPAFYARSAYRLIPGTLRKKVIAPLIRALPVSDDKISLDFKLKQFVKGAEDDAEKAHFMWRAIFDETEKKSLYRKEIAHELAHVDTSSLYKPYFARTNATKPLNRLLYADIKFYLPNDMLVKVDRMSMAHSLEARVPYLDHRVVEFLASVPPRLKLKWLYNKKYILKMSLKTCLPEKILHRKKQGFNAPKNTWIKKDFKEFVMDTLLFPGDGILNILDKSSIHSLLDDHLKNKKDNSHQIWGLLILSLWWKHFMK